LGHRNRPAISATVGPMLVFTLTLGLAVVVWGGNVAGQSGNLRATGPLQVCARNPRYFSDSSGRAIYFAAAHTWTNLEDIGFTDPPPLFDYEAYLGFLTDYHYNYIRLWRWETPKDIEKHIP